MCNSNTGSKYNMIVVIMVIGKDSSVVIEITQCNNYALIDIYH